MVEGNNSGKHKYELGIVVPVYKLKEQYLQECIDSLLNQSGVDMQIILVDDCSPDNCGKLCEKLALKNRRINVVHHENNKGLSAARNTGLRHLNCEWVSFVDGDDWVDTDTFKMALDFIKRDTKKPDVVMFPGCLSYKDREIKDKVYRECEWRTQQEKECLQILALSMPLKIYPERATAFDTAWAKLISYDFLIKNNIIFRDLPYREDGMYFQELIEYADIVKQIPCGMYHYRMTSGSMVHGFRPNALEEQTKYMKMLWNFGKTHSKNEDYFNSIYAAALVSMQVCITGYFYHKDNKELKNRRKSCKEFFSKFPYRNVFKKLHFYDMKRNFMVKAILIYLQKYALVQILREIYLKKKNYICFE